MAEKVLHQYTNGLINEVSPYLLQHAHNPVDWHSWSENLFETAKREDILILVSIGYSACHWCHVMAHESFEDEEVARVMNKHFICIKVDREERPDVDHHFMTAVQLMGIHGGWPLNCIALPDGRPVWGGTYFPKEIWIRNLLSLSNFYKNNKSKVLDYAERLSEGISQVSLNRVKNEMIPGYKKITEHAVNTWKQMFDTVNGGHKGSPKFPMPVNLRFLLNYGYRNNDKSVLQFVKLTLLKMAFGGIYDHAGGGFARYSVDELWKVPHFEKMLYDNAQLLSLYSEAFQYFGDEEFATVVHETVTFLEQEMLSQENAFYSSLDADSEGEEGKFYTWKENELREVLKEDYELFSEFYNINEIGHWESGNYLLFRTIGDADFALKKDIPPAAFRKKRQSGKPGFLKSGEIVSGRDLTIK